MYGGVKSMAMQSHQQLEDDDIDIMQPSDDDLPHPANNNSPPIDQSTTAIDPISVRICLFLRTVLCSRIGLLVLVTGYTLFGALLFRTLEGGGWWVGGSSSSIGGATAGGLPQHVQKSREDCLKELWTITERLNVLYEKNWTRLVTEQLKRFERAVIESRNIDGITSPQGWTFYGSLLYSITLLTTIGHGRLSPKTALGKVVAIVYAAVGVPLMLVLLSSFGSVLAGGARKGYARICCKHKDRKNDQMLKLDNSIVGYRPAPTNMSSSQNSTKQIRRSSYDDCSIRIPTGCNSTTPPKHHHHHHHATTSFKHMNSSPKQQLLNDFNNSQTLPRKAVLLATVRASHHHHNQQQRCNGGTAVTVGCSAAGTGKRANTGGICANHASPNNKMRQEQLVMVLDEGGTDDPDEHIVCSQHTPSRVPLIYRPPERFQSSPSPSSEALSPGIIVPNDTAHNSGTSTSVPASLVVALLLGYLCLGAVVFAGGGSKEGGTWRYLDAAYLCFIALTTIGLDDRLALLLTESTSSIDSSSDQIRFSAQLQMLAFCLYISVGLVLIAMSFSLVQDELTNRYRTVLGDRQQNNERKSIRR